MESSPLIVCAMLTADRHALAERAIRCFQRQTHKRSVLYVLDNGQRPQFEWCAVPGGRRWGFVGSRTVCVEYQPDIQGLPMFELMNRVTDGALTAVKDARFIAKWDSDDWSHRQRLAEQLERIEGLNEEGKPWMVTGYNSIPIGFHVSCTLCEGHKINRMYCTPCMGRGYYCGAVSEYRNPSIRYAVGSSLLYRPEAWRGYPFPDTRRPNAPAKYKNPRGSGADTAFVTYWGSKGGVCGVDSTGADGAPRLIAALHGGNVTLARSKSALVPSELDRQCAIRLIMENTD